MKKQGFTLAETLVTLAIVGVIAAISIPQVVTMAQKHKSEAMVAKIVYQTELGVQKMFNEYNSDPDNESASQVDKILLVKHWNEKLAIAMRLTEKQPKIAFFDKLFMAPAYASDCTFEHPKGGMIQTCSKYEDTIDEYGTHRTWDYKYKSVYDFINGTETIHTESKFRFIGLHSNLDSDHVYDRICYTGYPCTECSDEETITYINTGKVEKITDKWDVCSETPNADDPEPIADIPVPKDDKPSVSFDKTYHVFGLPAEVKLSVPNLSDSDSFKADKTILTMYIDTNGFDSNPNKPGVDQFLFSLTNAGKMLPVDDETKEFVKNGYKIK